MAKIDLKQQIKNNLMSQTNNDIECEVKVVANEVIVEMNSLDDLSVLVESAKDFTTDGENIKCWAEGTKSKASNRKAFSARLLPEVKSALEFYKLDLNRTSSNSITINEIIEAALVKMIPTKYFSNQD